MEGWEFRLEEGALADTLVAAEAGLAGQSVRLRLWSKLQELVLPTGGGERTLLTVARIDERGCAVFRGDEVVWASDLLFAKRRVISLSTAFMVAAVAVVLAVPLLAVLVRQGHEAASATLLGLLLVALVTFLLIVRNRSGLTMLLSSARDEVTLRAKPWHLRCTSFSLRNDVAAAYTFSAWDDPAETTLAVLVGQPDLIAVLLPLRDGARGRAALDWHLRRGRGFPAGQTTYAQHLVTCRNMADHRNRVLRGQGAPGDEQFVKSEEDEIAIAVAQIADLESMGGEGGGEGGNAGGNAGDLPPLPVQPQEVLPVASEETEVADDAPLLAHEL